MDDYINTMDPVHLPRINENVSGLASRHASVSKEAKQLAERQTGMQFYTTFIRKVNDFTV